MIKKSGWGSGLVEWVDGDMAYISVVFSWNVNQAWSRGIWYKQGGYEVVFGGPAVTTNRSTFELIGKVPQNTANIDALIRHNQSATFTSRGCIRKCPFCIVPKIEGDLYELTEWRLAPIICDNNFLACSNAHFNRVIDRLKPLSGVDFNQGLDARLLTNTRADRLRELDLCAVRLAWDNTALEVQFMRAFEILRAAGFPASLIRCYVLIGFNDTPEDALYRLETVRKLGALPNPMRYQPILSQVKNSYVGENWTHRELVKYMRYWSNTKHLRGIPFAEFCDSKSHGKNINTVAGEAMI